LLGYQAKNNYESDEVVANEVRDENYGDYNLFRVLLYYIIIGFFGWIVFYFFFTSSWFEINKVSIYGNKYLSNDRVLTQGILDRPINIFHFDIVNACDKISKNPWIKEVKMKKVFPGRLEINIKEREPGALLYSGEQYYLVTAEGVILTRYKQLNNEFNQFLITGLDIGSKKAGDIIRDPAFFESQKIIYALKNIFPDQFYKIETISEEEFLLFHNNKNIKVRVGNSERLINEWYLLESALQKVLLEDIPLQEINMKYRERLLIILQE
jgi:cell division protein FtsQ